MKCPFCMEDIQDDSIKCSQCNSDLLKACPFCKEMIQSDAVKCKYCGSVLNTSSQPQAMRYDESQQPQQAASHGSSTQTVPPGVAGFSWGAFLFNWIWAIGNKVWIGLLALIPIVGFVMAFVLGFKGREWAWKSGQWESIDHFNRVQKKWSQWAVGLTLVFGVGGILLAIAIPQFEAYSTKGHNAIASSAIKNLKTTLESKYADNKSYPESLELSGFKVPDDIYMNCSINPGGYVCVSAHKKGTLLYIVDSTSTKVDEQPYKAGDAVRAPYDPPVPGSAKADEYMQPSPQVDRDQQAIPQQSGEQMTFSPSFDCAKASTGAERLICSNQELAQADVQLAQVYRNALNMSSNKPEFKKEQAAWIRNQRDACSDASTMLRVYQDRISQLSR